MTTEGTVHVFRTNAQPATRIAFRIDEKRTIVSEYSERTLFRCLTCKRLRWAKNMVAYAYYDCTQFYCREKCQHRSWRAARREP